MYFAFALEGLFYPIAEYVRGMEGGLRELGHDAKVARGADALPAEARPVLDARLLPALLPERDALVRRDAIALFHDPGTTVGPVGGQARAALREWLPRLERVVATSPIAADWLTAELNIAGGRLATIPPGVPDAPRSAGSDGVGCSILAVGALAPSSGHDALLRSVARLPDLDWSLAIAGCMEPDLAHAAMLLEQARQLGVADRVRIHADPDPATLEALWRDADVFALAARGTGAVAIAEAVRRGLPVAATEGVGVPEGAGTESARNDDATFSKCLRRMIFDLPLRRAMAEAAWQAGQALPGWPAQAARFVEHVG